MKPLWKIPLGEFAGWRSGDDQLYDSRGKHIGYFSGMVAYSTNGSYLGELYDDEWIGKKEGSVEQVEVFAWGFRQCRK